MYQEDIELAKKVRLNACSPYSNFEVGAALRTKSGKVYTENDDYSLTYYRYVYLNSNKPYQIEVDPENISDFGDYTVVVMPTRNGVLSGEARDTFTVVK